MIVIGLNNTTSIYQGGENIAEVYQGNELIWGGKPSEDYKEALSITANAPSEVGLVKLSNNQTLEYSLDSKSWNTFDTTTSISLDSGEKMFIRGILSNGSLLNTQFKITGDVHLDGDIRYVWNYQNPDTPLYDYCGYQMFYNCKGITSVGENLLPSTEVKNQCYTYMFSGCTNLQNAPKLPAMELPGEVGLFQGACYAYMFSGCTSLTEAPELPATTLGSSCYGYMFDGCTSLQNAPELPAPTLTSSCYQNMFSGCTSLTSAPELPATTLASNCYQSMFDGCTSLQNTPELPATTLAGNCYQSMFNGCTSLQEAPELPATELASSCYAYMFSGCTNLNYIKCLVEYIPQTYYVQNWVSGVAPTGTFVKSPNMFDWTIGISGIPTGWTIKDEGEINGLTFQANASSTIGLANLSTNQTLEYSLDNEEWNNFDINTQLSLIKNQRLYVRGILSDNNTSSNYTKFKITGNVTVYGDMRYIWDYQNPDTPLKERCGYRMFYECDGITKVGENLLPSTELSNSCYQDMFGWCKSLQNTPKLPAMVMKTRCYNAMFYYCTSLTKSPELPATTLAQECYYQMFYNCSKLQEAPELPATKIEGLSYANMFYYCSNLKKAPELPATELTSSCYQWMFAYCTSLEKAPELPATKLYNLCYSSMFRGCTSLTEAPELPATELASSCYKQMFYGCSKLKYIKCLAENISASSCTENWVSGVAPSGTFIKADNMNDWTTGVNGIPTGWEAINNSDYKVYNSLIIKANAPSDVRLQQLSNYQTLEYSRDGEQWFEFRRGGSFSLDSGEEMQIRGILTRANSSSSGNYTQFSITGDVHLDGDMRYVWNYENPEAALYNYCGYRMFYQSTGITSVGNILPSKELSDYCYYNMFYGCSNLQNAPELPATVLKKYCYEYMFANCTSLKTAPQLPATTLANDCYYGMFSGCTNLNYIKCLADEINGTLYTFLWVAGVANNGTFVKSANNNSWTTGVNGIPEGWTVINES